MGKKLYIGNLPYSVTDQSLRTLFEEAGEVTDATVIVDRETNRSRGFGFVEMGNDEDATKAINQLNGHTIDNRQIQVSEARPREDRPPRRDSAGDRGSRDDRGGNRRDRF